MQKNNKNLILKKIEIYGFKSFANKTVIDLKDNITAIVGPNGSGKSNIVDAIRWVFGEQSLKSLRGAKTEDVIFTGTEFRKKLGFAECFVTLDNSNKIFPVDYEEITIGRKLYRDNESEYFLNGKTCKLKTITNILMDTGIGKDGYSIIGQGKINEILSNNKEDRRKIFDEAACIGKYKARKKETEKKIEDTDINLTRVTDILVEITSNLTNLEEEAKVAKEFLKIKEILKFLEIINFKKEIEEYKIKNEKFDGQIKRLEMSLNEFIQMQTNNKIKENNLKKELDEIVIKIDDTKDIKFQDIKEIENLRIEIIYLRESIEKNIKDKEQYILDLEEFNKIKYEKENEIEIKKLKKAQYENDSQEYVKKLQEKEDKLKKLTAKLSNNEKYIENKKNNLELIIDEKYTAQSNINIMTEKLENSHLNLKNLNKKNMEIVLELDRKRIIYNDFLKENKVLADKKIKLTNKLEKFNSEIDRLNENIQEKEENLKVLEHAQKVNETKFNMLIALEKSKDGYIYSVKELLKEKEQNSKIGSLISGVVANILKVSAKYNQAIEMALGVSLQNIVVDKQEDAKSIIEYLKLKNIGRASFLPIDKVEGIRLTNVIKNEGYLGVAADLVQYDKKYENIVNYLLGKIIIVDELNSAINLSKLNKGKLKIVTLDGDIINPSGMMTGGSNKKNKTVLLNRENEIKEIQNEIQKSSKKIENIVIEINKLKEQKIQLKDEKEKILLDKNNQEVEFAVFEEKKSFYDKEINTLEINLQNIKMDIEKEKENISQLKIENKLLEKEVENKEIEITKIKAEIDSFKSLNTSELDELNEEVTDLKIAVSSFKDSIENINEILIEINKSLDNAKENIRKLENNIKRIDEQNLKYEQKIVENENNILSKVKVEEEFAGKIKTLTEEKENINKKLEKLLIENEKNLQEIEILKDKKSKQQLELSKLEFEREKNIDNMWENYEITFANIGNYDKQIEEFLLDNIDITNNIKNLIKENKNKLKEFGSVNISSIDIYQKTKERYDFLNKQKEDLENSIILLEKVMTDMINTMQSEFINKFSKIADSFQNIFVELFGGGKAQIYLENEKDPLNTEISIHVQPPGKKLQTMTLLSGGEKALTAIALLFAILHNNPTPFCILDEIEAALDDVNVSRFSEFLEKYETQTQFLVITHRKGTMESAGSVYGVTMEEKGVTKLVALSLK